MNVCTCVVVLDEERRRIWASVFPDGRVPIVVPMPERASLQGRGWEMVLKADLPRIGPERLQALARIMAARRGEDPDTVLQEWQGPGLVIRLAGTTTIICDLHRRFLEA